MCVVTLAHLYMFEWVFCSHTLSVVWKYFSSQPKLVLNLRIFSFTNRQALKNAGNSNCSSSNGFDPKLMTMTKLSAGFPSTLWTTSSLFEDQPRSRILRCPRMLVHFAVSLADCEEWFGSLAGFLPSARRATVRILFSVEQSQVVDWVVAEAQLENPMLRILNSLSSCCDVEMLLQSTSVIKALCILHSTRSVTTKSCTFRWRTIAQVSLDGFRAFSDGPFPASVLPGGTFFVVQKVRVWHRECCSS